MTYTGYTSDGGCASADAVLADLQDIKSKGFSRIRMYGVDCNQLSTVADQAASLGFTLTLGIYIDNTGTARGSSDLATMISWGNWNNVDIINIGMSTLVSFSDGKVTNVWLTASCQQTGWLHSFKTQQHNSAQQVILKQSVPQKRWPYIKITLLFAIAVDSCVHVNIHPYYNPGTQSSDAGTFLLSQKGIVESACSGKNVIVSETGWPSGGGNDGNAVASSSDQATAIAAIHDATNGDVTFFSYGDDAWKAPGPEQHFGMNFFMWRGFSDFVLGCGHLF